MLSLCSQDWEFQLPHPCEPADSREHQPDPGDEVSAHGSCPLGAPGVADVATVSPWERDTCSPFQALMVSSLPSSSSTVSISLCGLVSSDPCQDAVSGNSSSDSTDAQVGRRGQLTKYTWNH